MRAAELVQSQSDLLVDISPQIWETPELAFQERHAHDLLCKTLRENGLDAQAHAYGLETAFVASAGTEGPEIAVLCEYDALPGIGHACGHNVIAGLFDAIKSIRFT